MRPTVRQVDRDTRYRLFPALSPRVLEGHRVRFDVEIVEPLDFTAFKGLRSEEPKTYKRIQGGDSGKENTAGATYPLSL